MLENIFKLKVAAKDPVLATRKAVLEFEWDLIQAEMPGSQPKDLAKIRQRPEYVAIGQSIQELSKKWGLRETGWLSEERFSTWKWAAEAGMVHLYKSRSAELSGYAHAVAPSFLAITLPAYVLAVVTLCLLEAARRIISHSRNVFPQDLQERVVSLWQLYKSYHADGRYLKLFDQDLAGTPTPRPGAPETKFKHN